MPALVSLLLALVPSDEAAERLDVLFRHCHENGVFNGAALVAVDGEIVYEAALGLADQAEGVPLDIDTAFYLASVSKQFTALGALLLVEDGKLAYDTPLTEHFPELAFAADVTLHHLLTHTSGVPDHYELLGTMPDSLGNDEVLALLTEHGALDFEPGTDYSYSNGGYVLLSLLIGRAAGQPFADFMAERVFEPLGMQRTLVWDERSEPIANRAVGYAADGRLDDYRLTTTGAGGMYSTVRDLLRWDQALRHGELVTDTTLARAYTPVRLVDGTTRPYGYGWQLANTPDGRVAHHGGGLNGYRTSIVRNLDNGATLILLTNHGGDAMLGAITRNAGAIFGGQDPPLPAVPVSIPMRRWIAEEGIEAALARYDQLRSEPVEHIRMDEAHLNTLGYEYLRAGAVDRALAVFRKNVEAFPRASNAHDSLGEALRAAGDRQASIASYERSLELDPDNDNAVQALAELRAEG